MFTYRWGDAAQSFVRRSDGACIPATDINADFAALDVGTITAFVRWDDLDAARADLLGYLDAKAAALRTSVAGTSDAAKLVVYREKAQVADAYLADPAAAQERFAYELAALGGEATARGESLAALCTLVASLARAWRTAGLAIDAAYQGHKATIKAPGFTLADAEAYDLNAGWPPLS